MSLNFNCVDHGYLCNWIFLIIAAKVKNTIATIKQANAVKPGLSKLITAKATNNRLMMERSNERISLIF
jgi:hypothetical protein